MNRYDVGDVVRCAGVFTNSVGAATDPTAVTFKVRSPAGTITIYVYGTDVQLVKDSTGNYHVDVPATAAGPWFYKFLSTGNGQAAGENEFQVKQTVF